MRVLFVFIDGVGIGPRDEATNPFVHANLPVLTQLLGGIPFLDAPTLASARALVKPLDANLEVAGLPQSGTGQTTLFTGLNAPLTIGEHYGPYPDERLGLLLEYNVFHRLTELGKRATFANAYPPIFFERMDRGTDRRSATAQAASVGGLSYRNESDLAQGRAISASLTNERWPNPDGAPPLITSEQAGRNLERLSREFDFTLFEFFLTDVAGHRPARMSATPSSNGSMRSSAASSPTSTMRTRYCSSPVTTATSKIVRPVITRATPYPPSSLAMRAIRSPRNCARWWTSRPLSSRPSLHSARLSFSQAEFHDHTQQF